MSQTLDRQRHRTLYFLTRPKLWSWRPFLPVVRRTSGEEEYGVVFDAWGAFELTGYSASVFFTNIFELPRTLRGLLDLPKETFDSAEELAAAGWRVD